MLSKILQARFREGFQISRIRMTPKKNSKIEICLTYGLAPHVKIQYNIRVPMKHLRNVGKEPGSPQVPKSIRIDMNVLAHHSFAVLFINVHNFDGERENLMKSENILYDKLVHLHQLLTSICETDELLQVTFN